MITFPQQESSRGSFFLPKNTKEISQKLTTTLEQGFFKAQRAEWVGKDVGGGYL